MTINWDYGNTYSCGDAKGACKGVPRPPSKDKVSDSARGWNWDSPKSILVRPEKDFNSFKGRQELPPCGCMSLDPHNTCSD